MRPRPGAGVALADLSEVGERVDPGEVTVRPREPQGVRADPAHFPRVNAVGNRSGVEAAFARELIDTEGTGTPFPQCSKNVPAVVTIVPDDDQGALLLDNVGRNGSPRHRVRDRPSRDAGRRWPVPPSCGQAGGRSPYPPLAALFAAANAILLCVPSQNGFDTEPPQRHNATVSFFTS